MKLSSYVMLIFINFLEVCFVGVKLFSNDLDSFAGSPDAHIRCLLTLADWAC